MLDLGELVSRACRLGAARIRSAAHLVYEGARAVRVRANASTLLHAVLNVLFNAADACEARRGARTIRVSIETDAGGSAIVRVVDDGCGMSPAAAARAFDAFFTTKQGGTGLGLALAHRVVEEVGGRIELETKHGSGTAVLMIFPAQERNASALKT